MTDDNDETTPREDESPSPSESSSPSEAQQSMQAAQGGVSAAEAAAEGNVMGHWLVSREQEAGSMANAKGQVVAVVPLGEAAAFIAGRAGATERVLYVGASCSLRLSWMN